MSEYLIGFEGNVGDCRESLKQYDIDIKEQIGRQTLLVEAEPMTIFSIGCLEQVISAKQNSDDVVSDL